MAMRSWSRLARKPLLVALAVSCASAALWFAARTPIERYLEQRETCADLRSGSHALRGISFTDPTLPGLADQAIYDLDVSGDCYHAECTLDLRESPTQLDDWLAAKLKCRGDNITFNTTESAVDGFMVPRAVRTLHVRVLRNGSKLYDDTVGRHACPYGFCVVDCCAMMR
jgi:hypothetical protein